MRSSILFFTLVMLSHFVVAQNGNEVSIPSTPAFSILNYEPASIMRPANPKELSANILNSFDADGKLLMNLGIEVAPYWLRNRPFLTRQQYIEAKGMQAFMQTLMISTATVKDSVTGNNKLGTGFRFRLAGGQPSNEFLVKENLLISRATVMAAVNSATAFINMTDPNLKLSNKKEVIAFVEEVLTDPQTNLNGFVTEFRKYAVEDSTAYGNSPADLVRYTQYINQRIDDASKDLQREVVALAKKRVGLMAEFAGAASFYTSVHDKFEKAGVWLNVSRVISVTDAFNFSGRYFFTSADSSTQNFDFGLGYIKELNHFSVSVEAMGRSFRAEIPDININNEPITRVDKDFTYRLAAQASYRIAEGISVNLSLGKDFDAPFIERSGFFSIFGLSYDIFKKSIAAMPAARPLP
jgi:hypothetical protein